MPFPSAVDSLVDGTTVIHASQVQGVQRITVGPTWFNIKSDQYGAVGDNVTDDTGAFTSVITAAPAGSPIYLPPGTYLVTPGVLANITKALIFKGAGRDSTFIQARSAAGAVFTLSGVTSFAFEDMTLDGTGLSGVNSYLGVIGASTNVRIRNCRIRNVNGAHGVYIQNAQRIWIENNEFSSIQRSGVFADDPGTGNFNDHVWVRGNRFDSCQQSNVAGNASVQTFGVLAVRNRFWHVEENAVSNSKIVGIGLDSLDFSWVCRNRVDNSVGSSTGECIAFTGSNNKILENECFQFTGSPTTAACILHWCQLSRSNDHNEIGHNLCTGSNFNSQGQGIAIAFASNGVAVNDDYVHDNESFSNQVGIQSFPNTGVTTGSWSNVVVINNKLMGNVGGATVWWSGAGAPAYENGNIPGAIQHFQQQPAFAATITPDLSAADYFSIGTLTANITIAAPLNPKVGAILTLAYVQDATGGRTITYNAVFKTGGLPALSTTANTFTIDRFLWNGFAWHNISRVTGYT